VGLTCEFHKFNDGFTHLSYGDGYKMCKRMKINFSLVRNMRYGIFTNFVHH
jgi:hypothetical protein